MTKKPIEVLIKESQLKLIKKSFDELLALKDPHQIQRKKNYILKILDSILTPEKQYRVDKSEVEKLKTLVIENDNPFGTSTFMQIGRLENELDRKKTREYLYKEMQSVDGENKEKLHEIYKGLKKWRKLLVY